jgi:hypothetical protein
MIEVYFEEMFSLPLLNVLRKKKLGNQKWAFVENFSSTETLNISVRRKDKLE